MKKRVLIISDLHCGHQVGLSPPRLHNPVIEDQRNIKFAMVRKELWDFFSSEVEANKPYDILIVNGDCLEGKGERSGATELITADRKAQCAIAQEIIEFIGAPIIRMTYGTPSHTGTEEDWEDIIADAVGAKIGSHEWFEINGVIFDCKHKIGSSVIPHGRLTPLAREILWNQIWSSRGQTPKADVLIRSHTHYYEAIDHDGCRGFITPCLQGFGSKYGSRQCSGTIDIGLIIGDIYSKGEIDWKIRTAQGQTQIAKAEQL